MQSILKVILIAVVFTTVGCGQQVSSTAQSAPSDSATAIAPASTAPSTQGQTEQSQTEQSQTEQNQTEQSQTMQNSTEPMARVVSVETTREANSYTFAVTIESPDTGCDAYANWWEVVTPDGELLYRRILAHSHVDEQPFTRSGGPVDIEADQEAIVRVHMHPDGYSSLAMRGIVGKGLIATTLPADFAPELAEAEPQPSGCAF